jgi:indole-3-glycerol phosphate synthase
MAVVVPDILARIVDHKRKEVQRNLHYYTEWEHGAAHRRGVRNFRKALTAPQPAIISEIKKASPSKGRLSENFVPARIAQLYEAGGAAALSVLTDEQFFQGSLDDLVAARDHVQLPVLRKDFTIDEFSVIEAGYHEADAILLIAAILDDVDLRKFREMAAYYKMAALVEVHNEEELDRALASGADIIGVNNRNLHTFEVTLETSLRLAEKIPSGVVKVSESGIHSSSDVKRLRDAGFDAFLVGEHLMKSPDPAAALRELRS